MNFRSCLSLFVAWTNEMLVNCVCECVCVYLNEDVHFDLAPFSGRYSQNSFIYWIKRDEEDGKSFQHIIFMAHIVRVGLPMNEI